MAKKKTKKKTKKTSSKKKASGKIDIPEIPESYKKKQKEFLDRREKEQAAAKESFEQLNALCDKHREDLSPTDASGIVASIMLAFDRRGPYAVDYEVGNYGVEGAMDTYMARKVDGHIPRIEKLYQFLVDGKYTEDNSWEYGIDAYAFYIPAKAISNDKCRVFQIGRRSRNYLIFLEEGFKLPFMRQLDCDDREADFKLEKCTALHIRQIYDSYEDHYDKEGLDASAKEHGITYALTNTDMLLELSDNVDDFKYVRRPDLSWYKKRNFELSYSDLRDEGYVLTLGSMCSYDRLDRCLGNYYEIKDVFFWINLAVNAMDEEEK